MASVCVRLSAVMLAGVFVGVVAAGARGDVIDNFDDSVAGANGWAHIGDNTSGPDWHATGGTSNSGYITISDPGQGAEDEFVAPARYLGNDLSFYQGKLYFSINSQYGYEAGDYGLRLTGSAGTFYWVPTNMPTAGTWVSYTAELDETDTQWEVSLGGSTPTAAQWASELGNVTGLYVLADWIGGAEVDGLDSVRLAAPAPEPASLALLALGAAGLLVRRRRG